MTDREPPASPDAPVYAKLRNPQRRLWVIRWDEGEESGILCTGMSETDADFLVSVLGRTPRRQSAAVIGLREAIAKFAGELDDTADVAAQHRREAEDDIGRVRYGAFEAAHRDDAEHLRKLARTHPAAQEAAGS